MKREHYLRALSSEHHQALGLVRAIAKGGREATNLPALRNKVRSVFTAELAPHFAFEEQVILPELARLGETDLVVQTLKEHRQLRALIARLDENGALNEFAQLLKAHVRFEERTLFAVCQEVFDAHAITAIENKATRYSPPSTNLPAAGPHNASSRHG